MSAPMPGLFAHTCPMTAQKLSKSIVPADTSHCCLFLVLRMLAYRTVERGDAVGRRQTRRRRKTEMKQGTLGHDSISLRRGSAIGGSPVACSSDPLIVEANQLRAERTGKRDKLWPELLIAI